MQLPEGAPSFEIQGGGDLPSGGVEIQGGPGMGGGRMFGDATGLTPEQMATAQASGVNLPTLNNTINSVWLDALINLLEGIIGGK